jgi:TPR repeat protein
MYSKGHGLSQSDVKAMRWLQKAANQGDAQAQNNLSRLLFIDRKGVPKDLAVPQKFPTLSAAQGEESAMVNLTKEFPIGAPVSFPKASSSESLSTPGCAYCGIVSADLKKCTQCRAVAVRECQLAHWKAEHKSECL